MRSSFEFKGDCEKCPGLCCSVLAVKGLNKPAMEPCEFLDSCGECEIHNERESTKFDVCRGYDCLRGGNLVFDLYNDKYGNELTGEQQKSRAALFAFLQTIFIIRANLFVVSFHRLYEIKLMKFLVKIDEGLTRTEGMLKDPTLDKLLEKFGKTELFVKALSDKFTKR